MRFKRVLLLYVFFNVQFLLQAQEKKDSILKFSLAEAKAYALNNSPVVKNAALDLESAKKKIWETTAIGLPQVNAKFSYGYTIEQSNLIDQINSLNQIYILPDLIKLNSIRIDSVIKPSSYNKDSVRKIYNHMDSLQHLKAGDYKNSIGFDLTVSQLIFNGAYFVGLQTSRVYKSLSELAITKSKIDLLETVTNAYFLVLIVKENKQIIDSTYLNTKKISDEMIEQYKVGFIDETVTDQMKIVVSNLKTTSDMLFRQLDIVINLFKFQLGIDMAKSVELTDSISGLTTILYNTSIMDSSYIVESSVDFKLLKTQERLQELNLKYQKTSLLPTIAAFYQFHKQINKDYPDFQSPQMVGISASIPIFTSGQNLSRISQARISLDKQRNTNWQAIEGLKIDYFRTRSNYLSAIDAFNTQKQNLELSKKIFNRSLIQFKEGMISGIEFTQVQNQYLQSQSSYFSAINDLSSARARFEKLLISAQ